MPPIGGSSVSSPGRLRPAATGESLGAEVVSESTQVVEACLPDGTAVSIVAVSADGRDAAQDISARGIPSLDDVRSAISGMASLTRDAVQAVRPDSATVEFGVDVKVESGKLSGLIVSGAANATIKVTLKWESTPATQTPTP
ncbi:CU044_2847 family protein [Streptomyces sp. AD55]|uniref:CU044_2847 family protein n=1 Tax=Streptomyces sp. AD55 TaxID=3242895 RepID=UPI003528AF26